MTKKNIIYRGDKVEDRYCEICGKKMRTIGRSNEKNKNSNYFDWKTRKYHKKCYKENEYLISNGLTHLI